ncbi:MAG: sigma-54-dependent Fis family transcriptional regulator [Planctomycetes bacterium]|nr:sigma-54-dependent Fis family transcriptional regulator [Planctomycetota bacterium]
MVEQTCEDIVGTSAHSRQIRQFVERASKADGPVMLLGEPGTGKEFIARRIHHESIRMERPFLMIDCSLYYERELKREIFGYRSSRAEAKSRTGLLEFGSGGTCYLARVEELSQGLQGSLLEFIKNGRFQRLGDSKRIESAARLIVSSDKNLAGFVQGGLFDRELFQLLAGLQLTVAPLRDRPEDIAALAAEAAKQWRQEKRSRDAFEFSSECLAALKAFPWPRNFDELKKEIQRLLEIGKEIISTSDLTFQISTHWMGRQADPAVRRVIEELDGYIREFKILSRLDDEFGEVLLDLNEWETDHDPDARDLTGMDF